MGSQHLQVPGRRADFLKATNAQTSIYFKKTRTFFGVKLFDKKNIFFCDNKSLILGDEGLAKKLLIYGILFAGGFPHLAQEQVKCLALKTACLAGVGRRRPV